LNLKHACAIFPIFFSIFVASMIINPVHADDLIVSTARFSYGLGATVDVIGELSWQDNPVISGLVVVQVKDNAGDLRFVRVVSTGSSPSSPSKVRIVKLQSCDFQGNAKSLFNRGQMVFLNFTAESLDTTVERQVTLALDIFDSVGVSLSLTYVRFSLAPGRTFTYFGSMQIPDEAYGGPAICCASVLTDLPEQGGYPYCPESCASFTISGSPASNSSAAIARASGGWYYMSFKLPNNARLGNYSIYAGGFCSIHGLFVSSIARRATFNYYWIATDINRDGAVNVLDVSIVGRAFGTRDGSAGYNQLADVNQDGAINILDISAVGRDYGRTRIKL
jgi:hypothetical protein